MEQPSIFDRPEQAAPTPNSERFSGRGSGTRRVVAPSPSVASGAPAQHSAQQDETRRWVRQALDQCWRLDERLHGRLLWIWGAVAATSGGAVPLLASWTGEAAPGVPAAVWLPCVALLLAGFTWVARCRPKA